MPSLLFSHRVRDYRAGELERRYPRLGIEEGYLHVYGFMRRTRLRNFKARCTAVWTSASAAF